jgi:hypothetical protein
LVPWSVLLLALPFALSFLLALPFQASDVRLGADGRLDPGGLLRQTGAEELQN